jgi:hypothetical protein
MPAAAVFGQFGGPRVVLAREVKAPGAAVDPGDTVGLVLTYLLSQFRLADRHNRIVAEYEDARRAAAHEATRTRPTGGGLGGIRGLGLDHRVARAPDVHSGR